MISTKNLIRPLLLFCLLLSLHELRGQIVLNGDSQIREIGSQGQIFFDTSGAVGQEEITSKTFEEIPATNILVSDYKGNFWIKFDFKNITEDTLKPSIKVNSPFLNNEIAFYTAKEDHQTVDSLDYWNIIKSSEANLLLKEPFFEAKVLPRSNQSYYLKFSNKRGINASISLIPSDQLKSYIKSDLRRRSIMDGVLIFRIILILIFSLFIIRVFEFRVYSLVILLRTITYWGYFYTLGSWFSEDLSTISRIDFLIYSSSYITVIFYTWFMLPFAYLPKWVKPVLSAFFIICFVSQIIGFLQFDEFWITLMRDMIFYTNCYIIVLFVYAWLKKYPVNIYYTIPFLLGITSYTLVVGAPVLGYNIPFVYTIAIGMFYLEILIFTFFIGKVYRETALSSALAKQDLQNKEEQAEKLLAIDKLKTEFFTNVSHELKTPLSLIAAPAQSLSEKYPEDKFVALIQSNVGRLKQLINQILDIQRIEAGKVEDKKETTDFAKNLQIRTLSFSSLAESKGLELSFEQSHQSVFAQYDTSKVQTIIDNLISNAIKYTNEGSVKVSGQYDLTLGNVEIAVVDTGCGISEQDLPFIFDKFYRVNNENHASSGVGLALVKDLVKLLKGEIHVESKLGEGSKFEVKIPLNFVEVTDSSTIEKTIPTNELSLIQEIEPSTDKDLLLIVEDNKEMQAYLHLLLKDEYTIIQAFNGKEGIQKATDEVPDLIISDLMMPQLDGFEFSKYIRNELATSHVPILMLTAKTNKESRLEGYAHGVDLYLAKPFEPEELKGIIKTTLVNRRKAQAYFDKQVLSKEEVHEENPFITDFRFFLENNFHNSSIGVKDMATAFHISEKQLRRKLKSLSGFTPNEFMRKFRLQKAVELIERKKLSISEIAFQVGFEHLSYFSRSFQEEYQVLPSEYTK